ncbi:beta-glucosidase [Planosporangium flavigriseum]|uniref:beta-glucosidase n=1 Tax=Planosporangium flavigriseum TaxID=373681 RepID=A0A8J3LNI1_9ACTN|nr:glycoside hydrolase family 3 N-terminal domain-containing protein [Planosporangium flavigriseum]NJC67546.1 beta-glucosidase [Planosporangium flavigriseum]GIG75957.1 glycosyl hydrolase [Planosporangium flavigriseum]
MIGACVGLTVASTASTAAAENGEVYLRASAPVNARVQDLVRRMTLDEKVGQLEQIAVNRLLGDCNWSGGAFNETCMKQVLADAHTGSILSGGGMGPQSNTPKDWAVMINTIQKYAMEHSRLRIPIVYGVDAVHGHNNVLGATLFPHQIGLGAAWDPALVGAAAESTQRAVAATGVTWNFAPVADLARDQRWGRYYETYSEDPLLAGESAASAVRGLQNSASGRKVAASVKHFAGYSEPANGHDRVPADLSMRYLQDTILPSYKAAVDAGALTVMVNSGAINGVPVHASRYLLTDVLRNQWRFQGVVISDWNDVLSLQTAYHIVGDYPSAIAAAVNAGVDMAMVPPDDRRFHASAVDAVKRGLISQRRLDEAVGRVLRLKFTLGLFEHPYVDPDKANAAVLGTDSDLARKAATESLVLLRNSGGVLPLAAGKRVLVTGPSADSMPNQTGGWTIGWQGVPDGVTVPGTTIVQGLKANAPAGTSVEYVPDGAAAAAQAQSADAIVVVVGEKPGAEGLSDAPRPELAADQQDLVASLQATGKPVVVVVVSARPLVLGRAAGTAGLLAAWLPGTEGGNAVADVLYGKANPSGRLPVSWPKNLGNEPMYYQQLPGTNSGPDSGYSPAYAFGAGLSYTTYTMGNLTVNRSQVRPGDTVGLDVTVANTGTRAGDLVVPIYVSQPTSAVLAPAKRLVAFTRVTLAAGQSRTVHLTFPASRLAVTPGDVDGAGPTRVAPGAYQLSAGDLSASGPTAAFTVR